jgi:hypothetical protein
VFCIRAVFSSTERHATHVCKVFNSGVFSWKMFEQVTGVYYWQCSPTSGVPIKMSVRPSVTECSRHQIQLNLQIFVELQFSVRSNVWRPFNNCVRIRVSSSLVSHERCQMLLEWPLLDQNVNCRMQAVIFLPHFLQLHERAALLTVFCLPCKPNAQFTYFSSLYAGLLLNGCVLVQLFNPL